MKICNTLQQKICELSYAKFHGGGFKQKFKLLDMLIQLTEVPIVLLLEDRIRRSHVKVPWNTIVGLTHFY